MATIKVTYNSIARRFNITPSTTWDELESKLRSLYNIPTASSLTVSYTDEDDDVITLSSDLELKEVLAQQSSGRPIKLVLNAVNNGKNQAKEQTIEREIIEREDENVESRPLNYQHVSISEEESEHDRSTPLVDKEKVKEQQHPERTNDTEKEDEDEDEGIAFIISNPWARPSFFGTRLGPGFGSFDGSSGLFGPSGLFGSFGPFGHSQCYQPNFFDGYGGPFTHYFGSRQYGPSECGQKFNSCNGSSKPSCWSKSRQASCSEASTSTAASSAKNNKCDKNNRNSGPSCNRNFNFFHPRYHNQTSLTQEQLDDKLSTLCSMGFDLSNNALYEDLLKRYNGNLERVIELLLHNQQVNDHFDNVSKQQNEIVINEEKARNGKNGEIKQFDNDENKPYIL